MHRRHLVLALGASLLTACASRAPKAPLKPNPLERFGLLPLKEWPTETGAQFNRTLNPIPDQTGMVPAINPGMLGMAIGQAIKNSRNAARAAIADAMSPVSFDPAAELMRAVDAEFARRSFAIEAIADPALAARVRDGDYKQLPTRVDALVDIQLYSAGYYDIGDKKGYTPDINVGARVIDTVNAGELLGDFGYTVDYTSDADGRHFTAPRELIQPTLAAFKQNGEPIRDGLVALIGRIAVKLVDDVVRVQQKLPRID